jgi:hypothetical protein
MNNFIFINEQNMALLVGLTGLISLIAIILSLFLLWKQAKNNQRLKVFLAGKTGKDLEQIIIQNNQQIKNFDQEIQELFNISNQINNLAEKGLHKFSVIRFNPFKDLGGDQSFVVALLNKDNDGLVISSMHTREGTRVYSKPLIKGMSKKYELTEEEKEAIHSAI